MTLAKPNPPEHVVPEPAAIPGRRVLHGGARPPVIPRSARKGLAVALAMLVAGGPALPATGAMASSADCATAARRAAVAHDVPERILLTIARIESGRGDEQGWPWTVGHRGNGFWADTRDEALDHAMRLVAAGERNLDLGCFQINLHWHAADFASLEAMFDPATNATHAARLLAGHHARTGDWEAAVAAYHSRTPALAARYLTRFREAWHGGQPAPPASAGVTRTAAAPAALALLDDTQAAQSAGSLVRAGHLGRRLIGGAP